MDTEENSDESLLSYIGMLESRITQLESKEQPKDDVRIPLLADRIEQIAAMLADLKNKEENGSIKESPSESDVEFQGFPDFMPDGNCGHDNPKKTIEWQPGTGAHKHELQMVNVDGIAASKIGNVPYITTDSNGAGELQWAQTEDTYKVLQRKSGSPNTLAFDWVRAH